LPETQTESPTSTPDLHSQIADAVAELPETGAIDSDTSASDTILTAPAASAQTPAPTLDDIDEFLKTEGVELPSQGKKENRLPFSRVKAITANARKKAIAEQEAAIKAHTDTIGGYEKRLQDIAAVEQVMFNDPRQFVTMLSTIPGYRELLGGGQPQTQGAPAQAPQNGMPQPDVRLPDGSGTYSTAGLQQLLNWQAQQVEAKVSQRYAPIEQQFAAHQRITQELPKVKALVAEARTWPMFAENEPAILKELQGAPGTSLDVAYRKVVFPKVQAGRDAMRAEILAEINQQPTSTSLPQGGAAAAIVSDLPLHDQIKAALKR
jgi:hypothetical protein